MSVLPNPTITIVNTTEVIDNQKKFDDVFNYTVERINEVLKTQELLSKTINNKMNEIMYGSIIVPSPISPTLKHKNESQLTETSLKLAESTQKMADSAKINPDTPNITFGGNKDVEDLPTFDESDEFE